MQVISTLQRLIFPRVPGNKLEKEEHEIKTGRKEKIDIPKVLANHLSLQVMMRVVSVRVSSSIPS